MSRYEAAKDYVIDGLGDIVDSAKAEQDEVLAVHVQSIVYRLMDQV